MATEIVLPNVFQEIAFSSTAEQVPSITINNIPDKLFIVPSYGIEISAARAAELYSHTHVLIQDGQPASRKSDTIRWYPGMSVQDVINSVPNDPNFVVMSQIVEDQINGGQTNPIGFMDQVFQGLFARSGMSDPTNTNIVRDYFDHDGLGHFGIDSLLASPGSSYWNTWRSRFTNETEARKNLDGNLSSFFTRGSHETGNWMLAGYLDGWHRVPEHFWVYNQIALIEQKHLAIRRKVFQFVWDVLEGAEWKIYRHGSYQSIRFENPAGYIFKNTLNHVPPEMMYRQGIINTIIGDAMYHWGTGGRTTTDIKRWVRSYNGSVDAYKTKWLPDGQTNAVTYDYNNPSHPAKSPGDNPTNTTNGNDVQIVPPTFNGPGPYGVHDALAGRYMGSITRSKQGTLKWPTFRYRVNGGSWISGYNGGNNPVLGTLGDGSLSTLNNRNFGQHNIVSQLEYKKPICFVGGSTGNGVAHFCWPVARVNDSIEVEITDGDTFPITVVGSSWRTFDR